MEELTKIEQNFQSARREYIEKAAKVIGGELYSEDLFFVPSVDRGIRLLDGFLVLLKTRNITCAAAIYRMQIDSCMRVYAAFICEDLDSFIKGYMEGTKIDKFKDKNGNKMADWYLKDQLEVYYPGIKASYNLASGFVHFSKEALTVSTEASEDYDIGISIGLEYDSRFNATLIDLGHAPLQAAKVHMSLLDAVLESREEH